MTYDNRGRGFSVSVISIQKAKLGKLLKIMKNTFSDNT